MNEVVHASQLGKLYRIYTNPWDRFLGGQWRSASSSIREIWALRDININVASGQCLGVIGVNGAGKSTLLKLLTGVVQPSVGTLDINGKVLALLELGTGFNIELTGHQNLIAVGAMLGYSQDTVTARLDRIREFADIGDYFDRPVKTYSSGMVVRLAFAFYISLEPEVLIIDEALSVGDFFFQQKCATAMRELKARGTTILFVSHDMAAVQEMCDHVILLDRGRELLGGDPNTVVGSYHLLSYGQSGAQLGDKAAAADGGNPPSGNGPLAAHVADILADDVLQGVPSVGDSGASLLGLRVIDGAGRSARTFVVGADLRLECAIEFHREMACANFGVLMADDGDRAVWSAATSNQDIWIGPARPTDVVVATLALKLAVPPGRYHFNVAAAEVDRYDPLFAVWHDTRLKAFEIEVVAGGAGTDRSGIGHIDMSVAVL